MIQLIKNSMYIIVAILFTQLGTTQAQDQAYHEVPFIIGQTGQILVQASINDHRTPSYFYIEVSGQNMLRSDQNARFVSYQLDTIKSSLFINKIQLGDLIFEGKKFRKRPKAQRRGQYAFPHPVIGTLGPEFFKDYAVQFDFKAMVLKIAANVSQLPIAENAYNIMYRSSFRDRSIILEIETRAFGEKTIYISTRSPLGLHLDYATLNIAEKSKYLNTMETKLYKLNGVDNEVFKTYKVDDVFVERELTLKDQEIWFSDQLPSSLGVGFLKNYIFTIDFPEKMLYFEPINDLGRTSITE